jgi:diguanylate cyclase (GGDEF)-like protein/PAS domain S-box-containing protein
MGLHFVPDGQGTLYRHWAQASSEIVLSLDGSGAITAATPAIRRLGWSSEEAVRGLPLWALAADDAAPILQRTIRQALRSQRAISRIEIQLRCARLADSWFELKIEPLVPGLGDLSGAVCILRSLAERRRLEREAFAAAMTDPLTGFTNRAACLAMLDHLAQQQCDGALVLIDLDRFRAFNLRHGHAAGDRLLVSFADLLRQLTEPQHLLSRVDGETFAVIIPGEDTVAGTMLGEDVATALAAVGRGALPDELPFTASIGVAPLGLTSDAALHAAELAVTEAKARGRARVATAADRLRRLPWPWRCRT